MKKLPRVILGLTFSLILLVGVAQAGSSANYAINWQVFSGGGMPASAGTVTLNGSLGQTAIGPASSSTFGVNSGYWYGITKQSPESPGASNIYLPLISK